MTENDIKEELSYSYVHAVASRAGFACDRPQKDRDSVDAEIRAHDKVGQDSILYSPILQLQLKATCMDLAGNQDEFSFDLPVKNYNDLRRPNYAPRLLVVLILPTTSADWLSHSDEQLVARRCAYWANLRGFVGTDNIKTQAVGIRTTNRFSVDALREIMLRVSRIEEIGNEL